MFFKKANPLFQRWAIYSLSFLSLVLFQSISFAQGAPQRVISLAPHVTEMLFSAGAGDKVVGVVNYSDYPEAALTIENVGGYHAINIEKIVQLNPDLIIAWKTGNRLKDIEKLEQLGFKVIYSEPYKLSDIPKEIRLFGEKLKTQKVAELTANHLQKELERLTLKYQTKPKISAFYQIWNKPMMTINGEQFISQALNICGAQNVFADLPILAAEVSIESVIAKDPDVILLGGLKEAQQAWLKEWQTWSSLKAIQNQQIHLLDADTFQRSTERMINGIEGLCQTLDQARQGTL
ncbi:MAG: cobalamin-binding protein [Pseudomonadota bacterium]|nr:cobalamin-binding protein [Pseudomonadota bacterium]